MMVKLVLRGLVAHRARLLLSAVSVTVGAAFMAGTLIFSATLDRELDRVFENFGRGTDVVVRPGKAVEDAATPLATSGRAVPASALEAVRRVDGVAKARGEVSGFAAVVDGKGEIVGPAPHVGTDWIADRDLAQIRPRSGRAPVSPGELAMDANTASAAGHRIGDRVRVALAGGTRTFTLTGIFRYGDSALNSSVSVVAFEPGTAQRLVMERPGTYSRIVVHARDGVPPERLRDAVAAVLPEGAGLEAVTGRQVTEETAGQLREILAILRTFLLVFAMIAVFVGTFLIFNTFGMLVARRTRELALLRAVGASRGQITRSVLGEAAGVGLVGATAGLVAGGGLAYGLSRLLSAFAGEDLPFGTPVVPVSAVLGAYGVGLLVTPAVAYIPARRAARTPPVAAMRDDASGALPRRSLRWRVVAGAGVLAGAVGALAAGSATSGDTALTCTGGGCALLLTAVLLLGPVIAGPLTGLLGRPFARFAGVPGRLGRRNAQRNPRQTAATASALMIGLALIGTVSVLGQSLAASVERRLGAGVTADYRIEGRSVVTPVGANVLPAVTRTPGVGTAVPIRDARIALDGQAHTVTAGDPRALASHFRLRLVAGGLPSRKDDLLVSRGVATSNGWRAGSAIPGLYADGARTVFRVAGVYADTTTIAPTTPSMIIDGEGYRAHDPSKTLDRIEVTAAPGADRAATRRALEAALAPWPNLDLKDREEIKDDAGADIDLFLQLILVLLVLSVLVAALGIVNTLALAVVERTREIGMLRAVGLQRRQLRRMIRYEGLVVSLFGGVTGLGLGVLFGVALRRALEAEGLDVLAIPYGRLAFYLLAAVVIGVLASVWPARRAARMDILRAMATE
ncbi:FtsX-like permease family protein [Actinomadura sp. NBRC 104412]|uniref:ABC transporter permease n=1 Tax=Actinomadura sp. NBRC 104412 TaxID=3032203 RepID=UPI0025541603|nr:FtsX-like permease family protein [Actinomadura sp. NBRC 104412]